MTLSTYFATTAKGLEEVLANELIGLDLLDIEITTGGVAFKGSRRDAYRACLWLRTANRVLQPLSTFSCESAEMLYAGVRELPWNDLVTPAMTIAVDAKVRHSRLNHSKYVALKTKDAIVDSIRDKTGQRPNVNPGSPDLRVNIHVANDRCTVNLDLSGDGLHRRGYRQDLTTAPLRETLAAGLIGLSGWDAQTPFVDPMCGSGTLPLEAALLATRHAPGLFGRSYGFERWPDLDRALWRELQQEARAAVQPCSPHQIWGADQDSRALNSARKNASRSGLKETIRWQHTEFSSLCPPEKPGTLILNPPYGERLGESRALESLYRAIGDTLKQRWTNWTAWVLTGNLALAKKVGLKASQRLVLYNGPIECRFLKYELY